MEYIKALRFIKCTLIVIVVAGCTSQQIVVIPERSFEECYSINACAEVIRTVVANNWLRPGSARNGMEVRTKIRMERDGTLKSVFVTQGSGNNEFDQSALVAIRKSSPFVELQGLSDNAYNEFYSEFSMYFNPEDLIR